MKTVLPGFPLDAADQPLTPGYGQTYLRANRFVESIRILAGLVRPATITSARPLMIDVK
ncbi:hypothetical protein [Micromonospora sp. NPDC048947]|uniref:hypothetical protein n=1 Tax=Micromonospora sp. NPDC048947 TaxID=3154826 RepID=UPI0033F7AADD